MIENIATFVRREAERTPNRIAVIAPDGRLTCAELDRNCTVCAAALKELGLGKGTRVVLMVPPGIDFVVLAFALFRIGAVAVAVDPGIGMRNLRSCLGEAEPQCFVGSPKAHLARIVFGWARKSLKTLITVGGWGLWGGHRLDKLMHRREKMDGLKEVLEPVSTCSEDLAAVVFTSGSTGVPKGVEYTHGMFAAQARILQQTFQIEPGEVDLATFPLFALFDPAWGATTVLPKMDFTRPASVNPEEIARRIDEHGVTHMFGSPALLLRVSRLDEGQRSRLTSLKRVLSAGAPVPDSTLQRFGALLPPGAEIYTPYGATEALPVTSIGSRERLVERGAAEGKGVCIGYPLPGVRLDVIRISDEAISMWEDNLTLPSGEIGELVVSGDNVSRKYFRREEADRISKIQDALGTIWHRMGDLGYLDERGRAWFCGRKSQRVVTKHGTLFTVCCEGIFNQHPKVLRTALVGIGKDPNKEPVLCVELLDKNHWQGSELIRGQLLALGHCYTMTRHIEKVLFFRNFPVDIRHNSKIFRERLAEKARWRAR